MKFTLDAQGAQSAGQGIGSLVKAAVLGPMYRGQAEDSARLNYARLEGTQADTMKTMARAGIKQNQMQLQQNPIESVMLRLGIPLNQRGAMETRLNTGSFGPQYDPLPADVAGPSLPAPVDDATVGKLGEYLAMAQQMYGTGSNVQQASEAELNQQTAGIRDRAVASVDNLDMMNRLNTLAKPGNTYTPFSAVGNTGGAINEATGEGQVFDQVLRTLFGNESAATVARDRGAANASNASAGKSAAETELTKAKTGYFTEKGELPGTSGGRNSEGSEGTLSSTILRTLQIPALDEKGRPVRNPITGEQETTTDQEALRAFYEWTDSEGRRPTATAFSQWEARGRPGNNKSPTPAPGAQTMTEAPRDPAQRKANTVYQTPKGPLKWTGTGWVPAN